MTVDPDATAQLLADATGLCEGADEATASYWGRAAAFLARMALEEAVASILADLDPDLADANMASQLLLLRLRTDPETLRAAWNAWAGLSRACHQHAYELSPTRSELESLIAAVQQVVDAAAGLGSFSSDGLLPT